MQISKKVSGKKYYYYAKYYTKQEALKKALELKWKAKNRGDKLRTYIEAIEEYGGALELFLPTTKFYLWINENSV